MNILLISRCPPYPLHLGDRLIPYHLAEQLSQRHSLDLLAFYMLHDDPDNVDHYAHLFRSIKLIPERPRTPLTLMRRLLNPRGIFPRRSQESWSPPMWQAICDQLSQTHYDVVQLFGGIQVYEYRSLLRGLPTVITPYESYTLYLSRLLAQQESAARRLAVWMQRIAASGYERAMFNDYGATVVLTETDRAALARLNPALPLHVIPNGIDLAYFTPEGDSAAEPALLFVGNYEYEPNLDAALYLSHDIFPLIRREVPAARLWLVGNNPPEALRALAAPDVIVTGHVPDVRAYFQRATAFISPLRMGAGIKNKMLEAMAMGKALVATPISGEGIGLSGGTNVLFGNTPEELAQAAIRLLRDPDLRTRMGKANRAIIEESFTWEAVGRQYEALYEAVRPESRSAL
ncbi:MAG TPA: glycosyltransferase family 4 protein, partial [Aggregatilineales bacterium]|nr:glycosyltransferase family 4 protein [Aggregatilineales bacterium]